MRHDHLSSKLDQVVEVLELQKDDSGNYTWGRIQRRWASVDLNTTRNLFSSIGIGARGAAVVLRTAPALTLHNALRWKEQFLFLTSMIIGEDRDRLELQAALVEPVTCLATRTEDTVGEAGRPTTAETMRMTFPGVLTEKYARYEREETHAENETSYVLVVPKAIQLQASDLVTVQEGPAKGVYYVTICHVLDPYKNEYEIVWRGDV